MWAPRNLCLSSSAHPPCNGSSSDNNSGTDDGFEEESSETESFTKAAKGRRPRGRRPWVRYAALAGGLTLVAITAVALFVLAFYSIRWSCPAGLRRELAEAEEGAERLRRRGNATAGCGDFGGKRVILVTASSEFVIMFKNWFRFARRWLGGGDQLVVVAHDADSYLRLSELAHRRVPPLFQVFKAEDLIPKVQPLAAAAAPPPAAALLGAWAWESPEYGALVNRRPDQLLYFLNQGCTVVYSDIDMVWQKSPLEELEPVRHEFYVGIDECEPRSWWRRTFHNPSGGNQCTCFLYLKPTAPVIRLMTGWSQKLSAQDESDGQNRFRNQPAFEKTFREMGNCVDWKQLDFAEHPPGCRVFNYPNATILHVNWIFPPTLENKIKRLQKLNVWEPDW